MKNATKKIEQGLHDLIQDTKIGNENLIKRATILNKLKALINTVLLSTRRRLSNKANAKPQATLDKAFEKFNTELQEVLK